MAAVAILIILLIIWIWRSVWGKTNVGARTAAIFALIIGSWLVLAAASPAGAGKLASDTARSVMALASGLGTVLTKL